MHALVAVYNHNRCVLWNFLSKSRIILSHLLLYDFHRAVWCIKFFGGFDYEGIKWFYVYLICEIIFNAIALYQEPKSVYETVDLIYSFRKKYSSTFESVGGNSSNQCRFRLRQKLIYVFYCKSWKGFGGPDGVHTNSIEIILGRWRKWWKSRFNWMCRNINSMLSEFGFGYYYKI